MAKRKILIVEDNPDNRILASDILLSLGHEVIEAVDGAQGIEAASTQHPDLILIDLSLPKVDGWTATRRIKALPHLANVPVIALTAHAMVGDREKALEAGCDDYITKPIDLLRLTQKIEQYLK